MLYMWMPSSKKRLLAHGGLSSVQQLRQGRPLWERLSHPI